MARAAIALAAWHDRGAVTPADVRLAARLALPHRRRRDPFDAPGLDEDKLDDVLERTGDYDPEDDPRPGSPPPSAPSDSDPGSGSDAGAEDTVPDPDLDPEPDPDPEPGGSGPGGPEADGEGGQADGALVDIEQALSGGGARETATDRPRTSPAGAAYRPRLFVVPGIGEGAPGRRSRARTPYGRTAGARPGSRTVHITGTLFAAAPHQRARGRTGPGLVIRAEDIREPVREGREGNLVLFVVDASGSMAARQRMGAVKGAVLSLLLDAYQRRDKVGLVTFRGRTADRAAAHLFGRGRRAASGGAADGRAHTARRRPAACRRRAARRAPARPRTASPGRDRHRRPGDTRLDGRRPASRRPAARRRLGRGGL
jgi:magnesium chelatase subunit D